MSERKFDYKEYDLEGMETLETIAAADRFNTWMAETVEKYLQAGNILEIGSGIGNISQFFEEKGYEITLSDIRENYCQYLREHFEDSASVKGIEQLDLVHPSFDSEYANLLGSFDNLYALNVIEHIEDDTLALANCKKLLKPGGRMIILVPAYQALYNQFDANLFHFRRYTRKTMSQVFRQNHFTILKSFHFNFMGILGWFVSGKILKKETIPSGQMGLYNKLVPIFRIIDKCVFNQIGLSVIVVGNKPS